VLAAVLSVIGVVLACSIVTDAAATTLHVSPTGSDGNPGTLSAPLATPARALAIAAPGDTIYLRQGTYTITASLFVRQAGLTIASYPGERAAIVGGTTDLNGLQALFFVYTSHVTIANLELKGGSYYGIKLDDANGPQTGQLIRGCYIHHTGRDGLKIQRADGVLIENNEIAFSGVRDPSNAEGIDVIGALGATIRGNYIHDTATNGLYVKGGSVGAVVERNLVASTGGAGILLGEETDAPFMRDGAVHEAIDSVARNNVIVTTTGAGLGTWAGRNVRFLNNTVVNAARTTQGAVLVRPNLVGTPAEDVAFENNIVILDPSSTRPLVQLQDFSDVLVSRRNIWFSASGSYRFARDFAGGGGTTWTSLADWQQGMGVDADSMATDPRLDAADLYRPLADSPTIDAGLTLTDVVEDYSGAARPQGAAYDIGAHERPPAASLPAPSNLAIAGVSVNSIALTWVDHATSEAGFLIERSPDGSTFVHVATVGPDATSYSDSGLAAATTYHYRVKAYDSAGASPASNTVSATTLTSIVAVPSAPSNLTATPGGPRRIDLAWTDTATTESGFEVQRSSDGKTFAGIAIVQANTTTFSDTNGLQANTRYYYRVVAYNSAGRSASSNVVKAKTQPR